jgi:uncharacterized lipoprotein YddW (UPF0748 family)
MAFGLVALSTAGPAARTQASAAEVRGLWVGRSTLTSAASIAAMVREAAAMGVNTLFVQARGRGEAYYDSRLEPRATELSAAPAGFDPLAETIIRAHAAGLRVHAWVNVNLVASASWLPSTPTHVVRRHPAWLMAPRALAGRLANHPPGSDRYLRALAEWSAAASARVEGLFLSPLVPAARDYTVAVVEELARQYPLDGLHLDYIRYPGPDFDYAPAALAEFRRAEMARGVPAAERDRLDAAARRDPTAWAGAFPASWTAFRESALTALVARLRTVALAARPGIVISAAVLPDSARARTEKLQDWAQWVEAGYLDALCPMIYTTDAGEFRRQLDEARARLDGPTALWAGIGAYRLPASHTAANVRTARQRGADGIVLFSYEQLTAAGAAPAASRRTLRSALMDAAVESR